MEEPKIDLTDSNPAPSAFADAFNASTDADAEKAKEPEVVNEYDDAVDEPLTDQDTLALARELALRHKSIAEVESAKKVANSEFKQSLDKLHADASALAAKINSGMKPIPVRVRQERVMATGTMRYVRVDTGIVIDERPLTLAERQPNLPGVNPNPMAGASAGAKERAAGLDLGGGADNKDDDSVENLADED